MYSAVLGLVLQQKIYIITMLAAGIVVGAVGLTLAGRAKFKGVSIRLSGILLGLSAVDCLKLSLVLCRALYFVTCIAVPNQPIYFTALMIVIPSVIVYTIGVGLTTAVVDGLFCFTLFDAVLLKDFIFGYVSDVRYDTSLFILGVLVCVFIILMSVYGGMRMLEGVLSGIENSERRRRNGTSSIGVR